MVEWWDRGTEDGRTEDGWTVDVARIEDEDEDVGCGRAVDSRIMSLLAGRAQVLERELELELDRRGGRGVGIGVVRERRHSCCV